MALIAAFVAPAQPMAVHRVLLSPSQSGPESSAAQPAWEPGGAAQPTWSSSGAAQPTFSALPANTTELTVGFYNVAIQLSEVGGRGWKIKERRLASDLAKAFEVHALDILCLSELGEIRRGIGENIPGGDVYAWIRGLLSDRAGPPVRVYVHGHYLTIVKFNRVAVLQCKLVSDFVPDQADRCFQHLRVRVGDDTEPVSIINCHVPASKERELTTDGRMHTFLACHKACAGDRFIWGGDLNTGVIQLTALMQNIDKSYTLDSAAHPGSYCCRVGALQLAFSDPLRFKHGDLVMTHGLRSFQTNSEVGAFFNGASDAHDLVVAKVSGIDDHDVVVAKVFGVGA